MNLAEALAAREQRGVRTPSTTMLGWVVSSSGNEVTVDLGDDVVTIPKVRDYSSPTADDVVLIVKTGRQLYCIGAVNAAPVAKPPVDETIPPAPTPVETRTRTFRPTSVGSYRDGRWRGDTTDALQGDWGGFGINYGSAFYGSGPGGLNGTAVSGTVRVKRIAGGAGSSQSPTFRLLTERKRSGFPDSSATFVGPALAIGQDWKVVLPDSWTQALIDGTAGGIGIGVASSSPYVRLAGPGSWSPSFELTIKWKE